MIKKEKPKWYEFYICKVWRANYAMNQNDGQRYFALQWGYRTKYVDKPHWCSFTDREHKVTQDYDKMKKSGKETYYVFETVDSFIKDLDDKYKRKSYKTTKDKYGNKVLHFK